MRSVNKQNIVIAHVHRTLE